MANASRSPTAACWVAPKPEESAIALRGLERHRQRFLAEPESANQLLAVGESPVHPELKPAEHAAWTLVCSTVLNLDEAVTKE